MRRRSRGVSLVEALIAIFILVLALGFIATTLQIGLRHQARSQRRLVAAHLARKRLAQIRVWARTVTSGTLCHFDDADSSWVTEITRADPDFPEYTIGGTALNTTLYSPSASLEQPYVALGTARSMPNSFKRVKVSVGDPSDPGWSVNMVSLVGDPTRTMGAVNGTTSISITNSPTFPLTSSPSLTSPVGTSLVDMKVDALLSDGRPAKDMFFDWYIIPLGGNGTLVPARDGRTCRFINAVDTGAMIIATEGKACVAAYGTYAGQGMAPQQWALPAGNPYIGVTLPPFDLGP